MLNSQAHLLARLQDLSRTLAMVVTDLERAMAQDYHANETINQIAEECDVSRSIKQQDSYPQDTLHDDRDSKGAKIIPFPLREKSSMNYQIGIANLRSCLQQAPESLAELNTLEHRLQENQRAERIFGTSENTRNERSQIIFALNELALKHCGVSFNELCQRVAPTPVVIAQPEPSPANSGPNSAVRTRMGNLQAPTGPSGRPRVRGAGARDAHG